MVYDQNTVHTLYKKLLTCYPRGFRERFGESMEQTFKDICNERKRRGEPGLFRFVLWMFVETAAGIAWEHTLLVKKGNTMQNILTNPKSAALMSLILCMPLAVPYAVFMFDIQSLITSLNGLFTMAGSQGEINMLGRIVIFGGLLLLPVAFVLNLLPMLRRGPEGKRSLNVPNLIIGAFIILFIMLTWGSLMMEEISCLRGIVCD